MDLEFDPYRVLGLSTVPGAHSDAEIKKVRLMPLDCGPGVHQGALRRACMLIHALLCTVRLLVVFRHQSGRVTREANLQKRRQPDS